MKALQEKTIEIKPPQIDENYEPVVEVDKFQQLLQFYEKFADSLTFSTRRHFR